MRVGVFGDNEWIRRGVAGALAEHGCAPVVAARLGEAHRFVAAEVMDLVLIDPATPRAWDRWSGFGVAPPVAAARAPGALVVAFSSVAAFSPMVRLRATEAGVDAHHDVRTIAEHADLARLLDDPRAGSLPPPSRHELSALGVGPRSRPGAALAYVEQAGVRDAFVPGLDLSGTGLSRRGAINLRRTVSALADLRTDAGRATGGRLRDLSLPTWREVVRLVTHARGAAGDSLDTDLTHGDGGEEEADEEGDVDEDDDDRAVGRVG